MLPSYLSKPTFPEKLEDLEDSNSIHVSINIYTTIVILTQKGIILKDQEEEYKRYMNSFIHPLISLNN